MADSPPFIIEQVDIGQKDRLAVVLSGATLPDRGPTARVEQRTKSERPPGSKEPLVQVLGEAFDPISVAGVFNDATDGDGSTFALSAILHQITVQGIPCVLTWGETWVRRGLVTSFETKPDLETLVTWSLTFDVWAIDDPGLSDVTIEVGEVTFDEAELGSSATDANTNAGAARTAAGSASSRLLGAL